jgi:predicted metal-dependent TIM-barrel fold hydrolase
LDGVFYIDPHIHMVSRITDDYVRLARAGCLAVSEPAFWAGFDRAARLMRFGIIFGS